MSGEQTSSPINGAPSRKPKLGDAISQSFGQYESQNRGLIGPKIRQAKLGNVWFILGSFMLFGGFMVFNYPKVAN